jgi:hypothetical protein
LTHLFVYTNNKNYIKTEIEPEIRENEITLQNKNKFMINLYKVFIIFLYALLIELVIYVSVKTIFYIINKIKKIKTRKIGHLK